MYTIRALKWFKSPDGKRNSEYAFEGTWIAENANGGVTVHLHLDSGENILQKIVHDFDAAEAYVQEYFEKRIKNYLTPMRIGKEEEVYESTYSCGEGACAAPSGAARTKVSPA
jgi:S-adenosylmethionine:tRNA-ribosyltransferase-isomerase (queuine synthetase)